MTGNGLHVMWISVSRSLAVVIHTDSWTCVATCVAYVCTSSMALPGNGTTNRYQLTKLI